MLDPSDYDVFEAWLREQSELIYEQAYAEGMKELQPLLDALEKYAEEGKK